ncbi:hypothetical protein EYF80_035691 [Liparis tanakae]|uniref:Uncharacterized protein n=1 Tax=Liparis tanakae TaxID=230148 RepID=A0A4Z2GLH0_9TELE|nr:hypothetical protein EYF80_035691 [Liparis tanakae]
MEESSDRPTGSLVVEAPPPTRFSSSSTPQNQEAFRYDRENWRSDIRCTVPGDIASIDSIKGK